ncbi:hypothetical protein [Bosea sp. AS-1]|uniref:hypothetical protein n=1 Tax=Bosea sp. AS-1 TaxID=2015316 RepID=UPI000B7730B6|nr:hypothetical protein [Bosea sp. AS-1]
MTDHSDLIARLRAACVGHPSASIAWPHRVLHEAASALSSQSLSLSEAREEIERLRGLVAGIREPDPATATPYGIIDPDYARVFTIARCIAWSEGYALMMHGSFTRDLDLLAVPWTETASEPEHVVNRIAEACDLMRPHRPASAKPQGRLAFTLMFKGFGDPRFVDLSVMPRRSDAHG